MSQIGHSILLVSFDSTSALKVTMATLSRDKLFPHKKTVMKSELLIPAPGNGYLRKELREANLAVGKFSKLSKVASKFLVSDGPFQAQDDQVLLVSEGGHTHPRGRWFVRLQQTQCDHN